METKIGSLLPYKCIAFSLGDIYLFDMTAKARFEWDEEKNKENIEKHGVSIYLAQYAFADRNRLIFEDLKHSQEEKRYYCVGKVEEEILTVRFTYRRKVIRIFGAGYWRKGKKIYEKHNKIHK